jgi:C-terminal processing protease CtpA/Prc
MKQLTFLILFTLPFLTTAQNLTQSEKLYGLSVAWEKAKTNFAYFDQIEQDWDKMYQQNIEAVLTTQNTKEYYDILIKIYAQLNEGHTWIWYPDEINNNLNTIPIQTSLLENKVIITDIFNDSLKDQLSIGDEILKINGMNVMDYGKEKIMPFVSASTPQDRLLRTYSYDLFLGDIHQAVQLEIKEHKSAKIKTLTISREMEQFFNFGQPYQYKKLKKNIGYLRINSFYVNNYKETFDSLYPMIQQNHALILDLRTNGGGSGIQAHYVLSHFLSSPTLTAQYQLRKRVEDEWEQFPSDTLYPQKDKEVYTKPIALLIGTGTFSAAEDFCVAFDNAKRGLKVGSKTAGSTGNSIEFDLPGGGYGQVTFKRDTYPNGKEFVGYGIEADVVVHQTIKDFLKGTDTVLEKAIEVILKEK